MAITDLGPVITHEGAGMARAGVESQPRKGDVRPAARIKGRKPVRRAAKAAVKTRVRGKPIATRSPVRRQPVTESESGGGGGNVASFTTSSVNAPAGYMGNS